MKKIIIMGIVLVFTGCSTLPQSQDEAHKTAQFINQRSGFIEDVIATVVRSGIYLAKDGTDKQRIIEICNVVSDNINSFLTDGSSDPEAVRRVFIVSEPYYDDLFQTVAKLVFIEIQKLKDDGYGDETIAILRAASAGIRDGTAVK
jgi:hypothetical protein